MGVELGSYELGGAGEKTRSGSEGVVTWVGMGREETQVSGFL